MPEFYCDFENDRATKLILCPVVKHGKEHLHTECRGCKNNIFGFYETLAALRLKSCPEDPIWYGVYPAFDEHFFSIKRLI